MPHRAGFLAAVVLGSMWLAVGPALAAPSWQPLCPDGGLCSGDGAVRVRDGQALLGFTDRNGARRRQWISLDTFAGTDAGFVCGSIPLSSSRCFTGGAAGGAVVDADGSALYTFNPSGLDPFEFLLENGELLSPTIYFDQTTPPTIVTGLTTGGGGTSLYLSRDEGRTWDKQTPNVAMWGRWTNFLISPDGLRIWVNPGPPAPGLWQPPALADSGGQLDFTRLARVDDGSFPADVFALRSVPSSPTLAGGYAIALARDGMYISTNIGKAWTRATFSGVVDDVVFANAASADTQVIAARDSVFVSRDRGQTWNELAHGLPASRYALSADNGAVVANGTGVFGCRALDCDGSAFGKVYPFGTSFTHVTEFYHAGLDHYFITGDEGEKYFVRSGGAGAGWTETGLGFWAWSPGWQSASAYVCRYYGDPVRGPNSHFYSASTKECRGLLDLQQKTPDTQARWNSEGYAFKVAVPVSFRCPENLLPVHRAYNNGFARGIDSNHRYVLDSALLSPLQALGWISEGIVFCVPAGPS